MRRATLAIAIVLVVAACGDDGGTALFDTQAATSTTALQTATTTTDTIPAAGDVQKKDPAGIHGLATSKVNAGDQTGDTPAPLPTQVGDDPRFDVLWNDCADGDMAACDSLYLESPIGSRYEQFGYTCGNTVPEGGPCNTGDESVVDSDLDILHGECAAGNWAACDSLYLDSPLGSDYEQFGATCGGLTDGSQWCVDQFALDGTELDVLQASCAEGDWEACDWLFIQAPAGSDYEGFGGTCGGLTDGSRWCTDEFGSSSAYGTDPYLDGLMDACALGDWAACDALFMESPVGSEYEEFGNTCGYLTDGTQWCVDSEFEAPSGEAFTYGDDAYLDGLWDACAAGDWALCDELYFTSAIGSEYEAFGGTCGLLTDGSQLCVVEMAP
jgi:hypothetical protein